VTNRREKIEKLLAEVEPVLAELHDEAMAEIREAKSEASANVQRYQQASEELAQVEAEIAKLSAEREKLPNEAYRAGLDGDDDKEEQLRKSYRDLRPVIEGLEERRGSLKEELARISPSGWGHHSDATIHQYGNAAGVAHSARSEMEDLRDRLSKALSDAVDPVVREHKNLRATVSQLGEDRKWTMPGVGVGGR
jgi:ElaB/YqjD/DUF883 family membrane-anchored ribosome-binding protein